MPFAPPPVLKVFNYEQVFQVCKSFLNPLLDAWAEKIIQLAANHNQFEFDESFFPNLSYLCTSNRSSRKLTNSVDYTYLQGSRVFRQRKESMFSKVTSEKMSQIFSTHLNPRRNNIRNKSVLM